MRTKSTSGSFFYTLLGYLVILLILAMITFVLGVAMYWSGFLRLLDSVSEDTFAKWGGLTFFTFVIFWWVIKESRTRWRNKVF